MTASQTMFAPDDYDPMDEFEPNDFGPEPDGCGCPPLRHEPGCPPWVPQYDYTADFRAGAMLDQRAALDGYDPTLADDALVPFAVRYVPGPRSTLNTKTH